MKRGWRVGDEAGQERESTVRGAWAEFLNDSEMERDRHHKVRNPECGSVRKSQARKREMQERRKEGDGPGRGGDTCGDWRLGQREMG